MNNKPELTIGPILFHWTPEEKRDFYFRIAEESPVNTVYIGEVICSKRTPFFEQHYEEVADRLKKAGKKVIYSTLADVIIPRDSKIVEGICDLHETEEIEVNDTSALWHLSGSPYRVGQLFNTYNEDSLTFLFEKGATHICFPAELPRDSIKIMAEIASFHGITTEVQVYGRIPLALSARCYHARAHGRIKDNCQFVCEQDLDGMELRTLSKQPFLTINGVQTLSHSFLNLIQEMEEMHESGINAFRLSPHSHDMIETTKIFHSVLEKKISPKEATIKLNEQLSQIGEKISFANGLYHGEEGHLWIPSATA